MNETKLLPCPFCGGDPELVDNRVEWFVRCSNCKPFATVIYGNSARHIDHCETDEDSAKAEQEVDWGALKQSAIDAWNRRAPSNCLHQIQEPEDDIWPCVNIDVDDDGNITNAKFYAPGFPAGNHDVYPVRVPYMDEHTEAWRACVDELEKAVPGFMSLGNMNGIECAVAAIRGLSERAKHQEPAAAEQAAWHAGLDEGRAQAAQNSAADVPASGAVALSEYLKTCEQHAIVPDVGGAFASAFAAGFNLAAPKAAPEKRTDLVPGVMRCAKCEFQLVRQVLAVNLGEVFAGHSKTEPCPNGCGPLWPVTWKQYAEQAMDAAETMADRAFAAEKEVKQLRGELAQHPDDVAVDALASLMKAKLAKQRDKGYGGWDDSECTREWLSQLLRGHVDKGDPVDVANFCAFLSARGEGIAPQAAPAAVAVPDECAAFEAKFRHLDLSQKPDAWGHARYSHDAISLAWEAWQARAALAATPVADAPAEGDRNVVS